MKACSSKPLHAPESNSIKRRSIVSLWKLSLLTSDFLRKNGRFFPAVTLLTVNSSYKSLLMYKFRSWKLPNPKLRMLSCNCCKRVYWQTVRSRDCPKYNILIWSYWLTRNLIVRYYTLVTTSTTSTDISIIVSFEFHLHIFYTDSF